MSKYNDYLKIGQDTLEKLKYLAPADRVRLQCGIRNLQYGGSLLVHEDPKIRDLAHALVAGAGDVAAVACVGPTGKEYWRRKRCAEGGKKAGGKKQDQISDWLPKMKELVAEIMQKNPAISADDLTTKIQQDRRRPVALPTSHAYLLPFVRAERKKIRAGQKRQDFSIVYGGKR